MIVCLGNNTNNVFL